MNATNLIDEHNVCGFACHRVSEYSQYQTDPFVYSGPGVMDAFYDRHVCTELSQICDFYLRSQLTSSRIPFDSDLLTEVLQSAEPWYPTITVPAA